MENWQKIFILVYGFLNLLVGGISGNTDIYQSETMIDECNYNWSTKPNNTTKLLSNVIFKSTSNFI